MSRDLIMDLSKEIFKINKDILLFKIYPLNINKFAFFSSNNSSENKQPLSEEEIIITNLTSEYLAFRVKTTKKEYYSVNPTYCFISPNEQKVINFAFYNKLGAKLDSRGHKFRFEGFIIPESRKNEDIKDLFKDYIKKSIKVVGNSKKLNVKFSEGNNQDNNSLLNSNRSILSNYTVAENKKQNKLLNEIIKENEEDNIKMSDVLENKNDGGLILKKNKEKYESLKKEYNSLKDHVDNLKRNEELLNRRILSEKNQKKPTQGSIKFNYKVPEIKEKKLSMNKLIAFFLIASLVGFYLVK